MPELSDLPVEILQMITERCEFRPRFNLRSCSKLLKEVVDQSKFVLDSVRLDVQNSIRLRFRFQYTNRDGILTNHEIKMGMGNANTMEKAAKWITSILKNAEIGNAHIWINHNDIRDNLIGDLMKNITDNLKSPLKAREVTCESKINPFWIFEKSYVQRLTSDHDDPNFFREHSNILMNLDKLNLTQAMNIADQDVLSMKATHISLKSKSFSAEMINQLLDKFLGKGLMYSRFSIENSEGRILGIKIPDGFSNPTQISGRHVKVDGQKDMELRVNNESVTFRITRVTNRPRIAPNNPRD